MEEVAGREAEAEREARFLSRCRILFGLRIAFVALYALALLLGVLAGAAQAVSLAAFAGWTFAAALHPHRWLVYGTLCLDLLLLASTLGATGGLYSPLLAAWPLLGAAFALLFRHPAAWLPALLPLPFLVGAESLDRLLLAFYVVATLAVIVAIRRLDLREEAARSAVLALQARLREEALLRERLRLSREMHDGVGSSLTLLLLQTELALSDSAEVGRGELGALRLGTEEAIDELRRALRMLRGEFDLPQALRERCEAVAARTGTKVRFSFEGEPRALDDEAGLALFRAAQEGIANALKHASPRRIEVALRFTSDACELEVRDDGSGFSSADRAGRYGLRGLRERFSPLGGKIHIDSAPGGGTCLLARIPRAPLQEDAA